jgi:hypothetical protein
MSVLSAKTGYWQLISTRNLSVGESAVETKLNGHISYSETYNNPFSVGCCLSDWVVVVRSSSNTAFVRVIHIVILFPLWPYFIRALKPLA